MKKQLLWCALVLLAGFTSCKKSDLKPVTEPAATAKATKQKVNTVTPGYYVDLNLQPRKPGENFDTYTAAFGATTITVTGAPSWNTFLYPTLKNGVPTVITGAAGVSTTAINTWITVDQNAFVVTIGIMSYFNINKFRQDEADYKSALTKFEADYAAGTVPGTYRPFIENYISKDYSTQPGYQSTSAKLIRVTTGSHWAIATIDYPTPPIAAPAPPQIIGGVQDPIDGTIYYDLTGYNSNITGVTIFKNGVATGTTGATATGTYTHTDGTYIFNVNVVIRRPNGTTFSFVGPLDIS